MCAAFKDWFHLHYQLLKDFVPSAVALLGLVLTAIVAAIGFRSFGRWKRGAGPAPWISRRNHFDDRTKPFFPGQEAGLKRESSTVGGDQQRGSIMWDIIISLIYHQFCKRHLARMRKHQSNLAVV